MRLRHVSGAAVPKYILIGLFVIGLSMPALSRGRASAPTAQASGSNASSTASKRYHVFRTIPLPFLKHLGGRVAFESASRRLFIPDGKDLYVINADTGEKVGEVPKVGHASDIAFAPDLHEAFIVDSEHGGVVILDLQNLTVLEKVRKVSGSSLAIYDADTKKLFVASPQSKNCQVFDPLSDKVVASVKLGGYAFREISGSTGQIYFELGPNISRGPRALGIGGQISAAAPIGKTAELAVLDARNTQISARWKEPLCRDMQLIGFDHSRGRLVAGCDSSLAVIDARSGTLTLSNPIPVKYLWYLLFDEQLGDVFAVAADQQVLISLHLNSEGDFVTPLVAARDFSGKLIPDSERGGFFVLKSDDKMTVTGLRLYGPPIPGASVQPLIVTEPVPGTFRVVVYRQN
jgi:hypothetical protein